MNSRILQINVTVNSGSTGRIVESISSIAARDGFKSAAAFGRWAIPSSTPLIKIGQKYDYLWHGFESRFFDNHGCASRRATKLFLKKVDAFKPDIIHLHNIHGYYLNYPLLFKYLVNAKIPVVWTLHDCWAFTGHCVYYDFCGCDRWKTQCHHCPQKKTYPASFFFDRSKQNYTDKKHFFTLPENMTIVPVSQWLSNQVAESFLKNYPRKVIYNGIDTDVFHPYDQNEIKAKFGWQGKKILLGVASTWSPRKGLEDFIRLSKILLKDFLIVLVGLSEKEKKMLPANIQGIARTESTAELAQLYSAADVFVNPTWEDNYPTTNLEAISCGTPVITYQTGGSPESVKEENGIIVEKGNLMLLKEAVMRIRKNTDSCRKYALNHFSMQDRFAEYINLYNQLLNR
ncbi:MAG: glycosyltransferase [Lentisphaeria bacterium]|nr:glycosyltransferase [Lentisphaeria bacterium]